MAQKKFKAESKRNKNKSIAIRLILIFALVISVYFGFIKNGFIVIQDIYIYSAFAFAIAFVALSAYIGMRAKNAEDMTKDKRGENARIHKASLACRYLLILIFSTVVSLLLDYMIIILGFADNFGI